MNDNQRSPLSMMFETLCMAVICMGMIFVSCSSDNDDNNSGGDDPTQPEVVTVENFDDLAYFQNAIIEVDSLGNFMSRSCGEVLFENEPHHLYVGVESQAVAEETFRQWLAPDVVVTPTANGFSASLTDLDGKAQGTVYFTAATKSGEVAEVTASVGTDLKYFDKVTFLLNTAWPVNASAKIFHLGDVITYSPQAIDNLLDEKDETLKWVCVRESGNGVKPMFCTVTNGFYQCGSGPLFTRYTRISKSSYCPAESNAKFISKVLREDWNYWYSIFKAQGIPLSGSENYWIDMSHWFYYDAINLGGGVTYGYNEKAYRPFLLKIDWLEDSEIYSSLSATAGSTSHQDEGYERLFDGSNYTKWCSSWKKDGIWYVEFNGNIALKPVGYKLTTASDTEKYPGRNPKVWRLLGRNDEEDEWTLITSETNGALPAINGYTKTYSIASPKKFMYYRWEISDTNSDKNTMQVSRFSFEL